MFRLHYYEASIRAHRRSLPARPGPGTTHFASLLDSGDPRRNFIAQRPEQTEHIAMLDVRSLRYITIQHTNRPFRIHSGDNVLLLPSSTSHFILHSCVNSFRSPASFSPPHSARLLCLVRLRPQHRRSFHCARRRRRRERGTRALTLALALPQRLSSLAAQSECLQQTADEERAKGGGKSIFVHK